jgi:hypothetical protein
MREFMLNKTNEIPLTCINLLDLLYRQNRLETHVYEKRSLFNINQRSEQLGEGLIYFQGQYQSIKACESKWLQNIDSKSIFEDSTFFLLNYLCEFYYFFIVESCVFYDPTSVIEFMKINITNVVIDRPLTLAQVNELQKLLRGVMITPKHLDNNKKYKVNKLDLPPNKYEFEIKNENNNVTRKLNVATYFLETYNMKLKYPHLPCISVGDPKNPICFPMEVCILSQGQRYGKKLTPNQQKKIAKVSCFFLFI